MFLEKKKLIHKKKTEKTPQEDLVEVLKDIEDAPDELQLEEWKAIHGKFFVSSIDGDDIFIWRTLRRNEYKQIAASGAMDQQNLLEESIIRKCLLYPKPTSEFLLANDAGIIPTLFEQISFKSGFIPKEQALSLIRRI